MAYLSLTALCVRQNESSVTSRYEFVGMVRCDWVRLCPCSSSILALSGDECMKPTSYPGEPKQTRPGYAVKYPLRHGIVDDWDLFERFVTPVFCSLHGLVF